LKNKFIPESEKQLPFSIDSAPKNDAIHTSHFTISTSAASARLAY